MRCVYIVGALRVRCAWSTRDTNRRHQRKAPTGGTRMHQGTRRKKPKKQHGNQHRKTSNNEGAENTLYSNDVSHCMDRCRWVCSFRCVASACGRVAPVLGKSIITDYTLSCDPQMKFRNKCCEQGRLRGTRRHHEAKGNSRRHQ